MLSPYRESPAHSRDSSTASSASSPVTPTFSVRGHSRWPSSTSSLVTNPDSPANPPKSQLHDLVEEPAEREESYYFDEDYRDSLDEPLCICDTPFCEHRRSNSVAQQIPALPATPEWSPGDDYFDDGYLSGESSTKRRKSQDVSMDSFASRLSRRFSKRFGGHKSVSSVSTTILRSAPASRTSSLRLPNHRSITAPNALEIHGVSTPPFSPTFASHKERSVSPARSRATSHSTPRPMGITIPGSDEECVDRQELATTPLLPPKLTDYFNETAEVMRSPLQSPTVASPSLAASMVNSPAGTPILPGALTPPLSTRPSISSIAWSRSSHILQPSSDIPSMSIAVDETDEWAMKLGHANFHIMPEPYMPEFCDRYTCKQLLDDWESARVEFMRHAAHTSEHYGVTSQTYKLTEQKWAEIDAIWRANHETANSEANVSNTNTFFQPLAETQALSKMPSLEDPKQPSKFPKVDEADIVGPMVQYAKIQQRRAPATNKKPSFLRIFTDPASLLGSRTS